MPTGEGVKLEHGGPPGDRSKSGTRPKTDERLYAITRNTVKAVFSVQYGLRSVGAEGVPRDGGLLVVANHSSFYDICVLACTSKRRLTFVTRENLVDIPILGRLICHWGPILLKRGAADLTAYREVIAALQNGKAVVLFPEGTRTPDGELQPFRPGALAVVKRARVPIVAVGIAGSFEVLPRTRKFPRLLGRMAASWGRPFDLTDVAESKPDEALARMRAEIEAEVAKARALRSGARLAPTQPNSGTVVSSPSHDGGPGDRVNP
jgi:1-acyl-sn-glycerol-3-phosphate acyltransferase